MPYRGPLSAYALIGRTQDAFFKKLNAEGGINGRNSRDPRPDLTPPNPTLIKNPSPPPLQGQPLTSINTLKSAQIASQSIPPPANAS